jgi:hypothetical protein
MPSMFSMWHSELFMVNDCSYFFSGFLPLACFWLFSSVKCI